MYSGSYVQSTSKYFLIKCLRNIYTFPPCLLLHYKKALPSFLDSSLLSFPNTSLLYFLKYNFSIIYGTSEAEWLKCRAEVSGSSPGRGRHKGLCGRREPSDYVSFRRAVERPRFHTLNTNHTMPRTTLITNALHVRTGSRFVPTRCHSLVSSRMTYRAICCMSEKRFPPASYT